jgi:cytidyltransferase-like protein
MKSAPKASSAKAKRLRLGIYGGTFDPVHTGHLLLARDALEQLKLAAVLFVPCGQSPFKARKPYTSNLQRVALLRLALKSEPRFWLTRCELDRPAPSYSYDTAVEIRESFLADRRRPDDRAGPMASRRGIAPAGYLRASAPGRNGGTGALRSGSRLAPAPASRYICH